MIRNRRAVVHAAAALFALSSVAAAAAAPSAQFSSLGRQAGAISAAVGNQDMSGASEGLNGLFTGSGLKKESPAGVTAAAGEWRISLRPDLATARPRAPRRQVAPPKFHNASAQGDLIEEARKRAEAILRDAERAAKEIAERDRTEAAKKKYGGCRMNNTCPK